MKYDYQTNGTCARKISFEINNGIISNVSFFGGCDGNLKAIGKLVDGKNAIDVANILEGNKCGFKNTSCADQLSKAIKEVL